MQLKLRYGAADRQLTKLAAGWNLSAELVSLATRIRSLYPAKDPCGALIVPGSPETDCYVATRELARCLRQLSRKPVLVVDLTAGPRNNSRARVSIDFSSPDNPASRSEWPEQLSGEIPVIWAYPKAPYQEWPEVLASETFGKSLVALHELFGYVLIRGDYPGDSVMSVLAARQVDGVVLVVGAGVTAVGEAKRARRTIESAGGSPWGFVFDRNPRREPET